jgi:predicted nucleotidyltransferase component of viral defense system
MISQAEIRRIAGTFGVDPMVINHDYTLGSFLHYLALQKIVQKSWIFKGVTALAKCYFPNYRFSEDLDFTVRGAFTDESIVEILDTVKQMMQDEIGIRTDVEKTKIDVIQDDYGQESIEGRIYYRGPWLYGGPPRSLRLHLNRDEKVVFQTRALPFIHDFSDRHELPEASIQVYSLEEVFAEKLRALSGQRKFAIPRDLFDLYYLSTKEVDTEKASDAFELKCRAKGIQTRDLHLERFLARKEEYRTNWKNQLEYLIPMSMRIPFEEAWKTSIGFLERVLNA